MGNLMAHIAKHNTEINLGSFLRAVVRGTACEGCHHRDQGGALKNEIMCLFGAGCVLKPPKTCANKNRSLELEDSVH
jgi:hypothetical protein